MKRKILIIIKQNKKKEKEISLGVRTHSIQEQCKTNGRRVFINLIDRDCLKTINTIFNRNSVKLSSSCTENMLQLIKKNTKNQTMKYRETEIQSQP